LGKQVLTSILENDPWRATINSPEWKDGIEIGGIPRYSDFKQICRLGSKKGENINYRYCEGLTYFKNIQKTSENGQINGYDKNNYTITLVIEKDKYKMEQAYSNGLRAGDIEKNGFFFYYNVVDYDCKKV